MSDDLVQKFLAEGGLTFWCICTDENCWCANDVQVTDEATIRAVIEGTDYLAECPDCAAGKHVHRP